MFLALICVPIFGVFMTGGIGETVESIKAVNPTHLSLIAGTTAAGIISYYSLGPWLLWSASYYRSLYGY